MTIKFRSSPKMLIRIDKCPSRTLAGQLERPKSLSAYVGLCPVPARQRAATTRVSVLRSVIIRAVRLGGRRRELAEGGRLR